MIVYNAQFNAPAFGNVYVISICTYKMYNALDDNGMRVTYSYAGMRTHNKIYDKGYYRQFKCFFFFNTTINTSTYFKILYVWTVEYYGRWQFFYLYVFNTANVSCKYAHMIMSRLILSRASIVWCFYNVRCKQRNN